MWKSYAGKPTTPSSFDSLKKVALDLVGPGNAAWRLMVAFPEWPKLPWLAIEGEEREQRLRVLFPDYYPTHSESSAKDILPARLPFRSRDPARSCHESLRTACHPYWERLLVAG